MTEQHLDRAQVGPTLVQVCCKGVAKTVRGH